MDVIIFTYVFFFLSSIIGNLIIAILLILAFKAFSSRIIRKVLVSLAMGLLFLLLSMSLNFIDVLFTFKLRENFYFQMLLLFFQLVSLSFLIYSSINFYQLGKEIGFSKFKSKKLEQIVKA